MRTEELLKNISSLLKKHEVFLNSNPEIFYAIEERLIKAVDDEQDDSSYDDEQNNSEDEQEDMFNKPEDSDQEDNSEVEDVKAAKKANGEVGDDDNEYDNDEDQETIDKKPKEKTSNKANWESNADNYTPEQAKAIEELINKKHTHREAERMVNAHKKLGSVQDIARANIKPHNPSSAFLDMISPYANNKMEITEKNAKKNLVQHESPVKHSVEEIDQARKAASADLTTKRRAYEQSAEHKNIPTTMGRRQALANWEENYHKENPDVVEKQLAAEKLASEQHSKGAKAAEDFGDEEKDAIIGGGGSGDGVIGEGSSKRRSSLRAVDTRDRSLGGDKWKEHPKNIEAQKADEIENERLQAEQDKYNEENEEADDVHHATSQSIGAEGGEDSGFTSGVVTDNYAKLAQQNPDYHKKLQEEANQKTEQEKQKLLSDPELPSKISPERKAQLTPQQRVQLDAHIAKLTPVQQSALASLPNRMPTTIKGPK